MSDERRAVIREAMQASQEATEPAAPVETVAEAAPEHAPESPDEAPSNGVVEERPPESAQEAEARSRDDKGRFAKNKKASKLGTPPVQQTPAVTDASTLENSGVSDASSPTPTEEPIKAPQGWTPAEREAFMKAPPEAQRALMRREKEFATAIQAKVEAGAEHAKVATAFEKTVAPYMQLIHASSGDPMKEVAGLFQTAARLHTGSPMAKAETVATIIKNFGIDIATLDSLLAGEKPQETQNSHVDPRAIAEQVRREVMQEMQQARAQTQAQRNKSEIDSFAAKAEFFNDVREDMADLLDGASRRGIEMSLQDAYDRACRMHPEVSKVQQQRELAARAKANQASTQRAIAASSSIKPQAAGSVGSNKPATRMDAIKASIAELSGR